LYSAIGQQPFINEQIFIVCIKPPPLEVDAEGNLALHAPCLPLSGEFKPPALRVVVDFTMVAASPQYSRQHKLLKNGA